MKKWTFQMWPEFLNRVYTDESESIGTPKVLALAIEFHCKTVLNKVMPAIQFARYYFGNSFDAHFGSLTYHIVNGIMLEKFLFDLHRVPKRANSFGTHFQCYFNGKIPF